MRKALIGTSTMLASAALVTGLAVSPATAAPASSVAVAAAPSVASAATLTPRQAANRAALVARQTASVRDFWVHRSVVTRDAVLAAARERNAAQVRLNAATTAEEKAAAQAQLTAAKKKFDSFMHMYWVAMKSRNHMMMQASRAAVAARNAEFAARHAEALAAQARALGISAATIAAYGLTSADISQITAAANWANTPKARSVVACESGGNYSINTGNGYYGAWQFAYGSWLGSGGGRWASTADQAPKWAQDLVAYNYWQNAGWGPWACA